MLFLHYDGHVSTFWQLWSAERITPFGLGMPNARTAAGAGSASWRGAGPWRQVPKPGSTP